MNCSNFENWIEGLLSESLKSSEETQLKEHLKSCQDCESYLNDLQYIQSRFQEFSSNEIASGAITANILQAAEEALVQENSAKTLFSKLKSYFTQPFLIGSLATAAVAIVVGTTVFQTGFQPEGSSGKLDNIVAQAKSIQVINLGPKQAELSHKNYQDKQTASASAEQLSDTLDSYTLAATNSNEAIQHKAAQTRNIIVAKKEKNPARRLVKHNHQEPTPSLENTVATAQPKRKAKHKPKKQNKPVISPSADSADEYYDDVPDIAIGISGDDYDDGGAELESTPEPRPKARPKPQTKPQAKAKTQKTSSEEKRLYRKAQRHIKRKRCDKAIPILNKLYNKYGKAKYKSAIVKCK